MQGIDLSGDKLAIQRLREAAEKAKCELSSAQQTEINLPFITADATGKRSLFSKVGGTRSCSMSLHAEHRMCHPKVTSFFLTSTLV